MTDATAPWMGLDRDAPVHHVGYGKVEELIAILAARITASEFDAVVGISRSGIKLDARRNIKKAYKLLYRSGLSLQQAIAVIEQEVDSCEEVEHFLRFLRNAERGICRERRERD